MFKINGGQQKHVTHPTFKINGGQQKHVTGPLRFKLMVGNKNTLPAPYVLKSQNKFGTKIYPQNQSVTKREPQNKFGT